MGEGWAGPHICTLLSAVCSFCTVLQPAHTLLLTVMGGRDSPSSDQSGNIWSGGCMAQANLSHTGDNWIMQQTKKSFLEWSWDFQSCSSRCEVSWSYHWVCRIAGTVNSLARSFKGMIAPVISVEAVGWNYSSFLWWDSRNNGSACHSLGRVELLGDTSSGSELMPFVYYLGQLYHRVGCTDWTQLDTS